MAANQPRLMRDIIACTVADQDDVEIVGQAKDAAEILHLVEETRPEFVVISLEAPEKRPSICDALLEAYPHIKILAVTSESNSGFLYWSSPEIQAIRIECSTEGILGALRGKIEPKES